MMGDTYGIWLAQCERGERWRVMWHSEVVGEFSRFPNERQLSAMRRLVRMLLEILGTLTTDRGPLSVARGMGELVSFDDLVVEQLQKLTKDDEV